jgi:hypothetical protein
MIFETDMTTKEVLTLYGAWFAFIITLVTVLMRRNRR